MATTNVRGRLNSTRSSLRADGGQDSVAEGFCKCPRPRERMHSETIGAAGRRQRGSWHVPVVSAVLLLSALFQVHPALAAMVITLQIDGIKGEVIAPGHTEWIDVLGVSQGVTVQIGSGSAKPSFSDITILKRVDKATPVLLLDAARRKSHSTARIDFQSNAVSKVFYWIELFNVHITSVSTSASAQTDVRPTEAVSLDFDRIRISYQECDDKGNPKGAPVVAAWDIPQDKQF